MFVVCHQDPKMLRRLIVFESVTKRRKNPFINIFGWTLLTVVCVVFVFIGFSPNSQFLGQGGAAAEVNGEAISLKDYKDMYDRFSSNSKATTRDARKDLQQNTINYLVNQSLIVQKAQDLNIYVSDAEVAKTLLDIKPFYEDGVFSRLRYKQYLQQMRMSESEFENKVRDDLIIQKMRKLIGFAAKDLEIVDQLDEKIDQAQINVSYVKLSPEKLTQDINEEKVSDYLSKNEKKAVDYYNTHKTEYTQPEQVTARHILFKASKDQDSAMEEALEKAQEVAGTLTVENFAEMAKKYSDDPGSKSKGGSLGTFPRGRMVPEFEKAAFSTKPGEITKPIKSSFGYHIIYVENKEEASVTSFNDVKYEIAKQLMQESSFEEKLDTYRQKLKSGEFGQLEDEISKNNIKWQTTGFFNITKENIPGVGMSEEFLDTAMTLSSEDEYAKKLVYQGESAYLLKFRGARYDTASKEQTQMDFFKNLMKQQKANAMVQEWTDSLKAEASIKVNPDVLR